MKTLLLSLALAQPLDAPQAGGPFAIACTGTAIGHDSSGPGKADAITRTYVIDPRTKTIKDFSEPRQEFDDVCMFEGNIVHTSIAPGSILRTSMISPGAVEGISCEFKVNRMTGEVRYTSHQVYRVGDDFWDDDWQMQCEPTKIPVIDVSRRKF